jgi:Na+/melibiose symporter-like transporter
VLPALSFALCAVCLLFYAIDRATERRVSEELAARRRGPARDPLTSDIPVPGPAAAAASAP